MALNFNGIVEKARLVLVGGPGNSPLTAISKRDCDAKALARANYCISAFGQTSFYVQLLHELDRSTCNSEDK